MKHAKNAHVAMLLFAGAVLALTSVPAQAENPWGCRAKIGRAVDRYDAAVERYGRSSYKADKERYKVDAIKRKCHELFGEWWDPRDSRWRRERW
jgi:hypothetical protein